MKFFICNHCKNIITMVDDAGVPIMCCGQKMELLTENTVEASGEKHVPSVKVDNNIVCVNVGTVDHPMTSEHYIKWVCLETDKGNYIKHLNPDQNPHVDFAIKDEKPLKVYAYCNLHGLWSKEV